MKKAACEHEEKIKKVPQLRDALVTLPVTLVMKTSFACSKVPQATNAYQTLYKGVRSKDSSFQFHNLQAGLAASSISGLQSPFVTASHVSCLHVSLYSVSWP